MTGLAMLAWFALILQFILILQSVQVTGFSTAKTITNFFSYFTIQSNLLVALCLSSIRWFPGSGWGRFFGRYHVQSALAVYIFIVGLVYNLVLRQAWSPKGWQLLTDNLLHAAVPLFFLLYWYRYIPRQQLHRKDLWPWLLFPATYLVYTLARGAVVDWYPYPFIHAGQLGYGKIAIHSILVLLVIVISGFTLIAINRRGEPSER